MSRIIKPQKPIIKRITIDVDAGGQAQVNGKNVLTGGQLHPADVAVNLLQIATSMTISLMTQPAMPKTVENGSNGENKESSH